MSKLKGWKPAEGEKFYDLEKYNVVESNDTDQQKGRKVFEFFKNERDFFEQQYFGDFEDNWKVVNDFLKPKKRQTQREINENWTFYRGEKYKAEKAAKEEMKAHLASLREDVEAMLAGDPRILTREHLEVVMPEIEVITNNSKSFELKSKSNYKHDNVSI